MSERENQSNRVLFLVRGLAIVAAINCVIVPMLFAQQQPLFPLPGLYLIEIAVLGILGLTGLLVACNKPGKNSFVVCLFKLRLTIHNINASPLA